MYNDELTAITVPLNRLYLDPNNPRFWAEAYQEEIPDEKITELSVQRDCQKSIESYNILELADSILRNGFLSLDRIVVRTIQGQGDNYVALEGNRRLAALKNLHSRIDQGIVAEEGITKQYLAKLKASIANIEVLNYTGKEGEQIAWIFQGIRHISGIKTWKPAQRAKLLTQQVDELGMKFNEAGQKFGLTAISVGRLYRAYKSLKQMEDDDEYGKKFNSEYFTLFDEAYKNKVVRDWLAWDDAEGQKCFTNKGNLHQFYSWLVPDEENEGRLRRIHDPENIKVLANLLENSRTDLLGQIDRHEMSFEKAKGLLDSDNISFDWRYQITSATKAVGNIPNNIILSKRDELQPELEKLGQAVKAVLLMINNLPKT